DIPELIHAMDEQIYSVLNEKRENAQKKLKDDSDYLSLLTSQYGVSNETKERVNRYYQELNANIDTFTDIYKVDATVSQSTSFKEKMEGYIEREIAEWRRKKEEEERKLPGGEVIEPPVEPTIQKQPVKVTKLVNVKTLTTEDDVDKYINALSTKLKRIIKENKQIEFVE
ncbi:BREX system P-loop protein BrxC, partial [Bacillus paralicheniformis]|nr:BREX system P-loop protein BrxC [Bacillus paralicheniformis]